ncbi:hypothetical protein AVEN_18278-1 [Araneus ventricosus]|uniref:Uncharacterized protein n=1 Tax=Araneus ventricosus TaxID=182803 RepID=A0A4Y2AIS8_ARAVE|nr:hypothetical protein AVEN_18278-1 [Araneus ventricosus]
MELEIHGTTGKEDWKVDHGSGVIGGCRKVFNQKILSSPSTAPRPAILNLPVKSPIPCQPCQFRSEEG